MHIFIIPLLKFCTFSYRIGVSELYAKKLGKGAQVAFNGGTVLLVLRKKTQKFDSLRTGAFFAIISPALCPSVRCSCLCWFFTMNPEKTACSEHMIFRIDHTRYPMFILLLLFFFRSTFEETNQTQTMRAKLQPSSSALINVVYTYCRIVNYFRQLALYVIL